MDAPYNLLPSLHAALTLIVLDIYLNQLRGFIRVAVMIWFVLIALSPVLTYQHHVIDIVGGFVLALLCLWLFRWPDFSSLPNDSQPNNGTARL
jgi:membrane-associated phospholipid phosphatase